MRIVLLLTESEKSRFCEANAYFLNYAWSIQADVFSRQPETEKEMDWRLKISDLYIYFKLVNRFISWDHFLLYFMTCMLSLW